MTTRWIPALLSVAMALPGWVQASSQAQGRFPLTLHQVAQTLSGNGIQTSDEQVLLLAKVVASKPAPVLDILSIEPLDDRSSGKGRESRSLVKLGCSSPGICLPFYSIVSKPEAPDGGTTGALRVSSEPGNFSRKPDTGIVIRAGARAILVMDDSRVHVQVTVISLENGIAGHRIHVASPDHKQIYVAEVVSANLLKRSF